MSVNDTATCSQVDLNLTKARSLAVLASALRRARPGHPRAHHIGMLIEQCKNYHRNPDALRPLMLKTIERIEAEPIDALRGK